MADYDAEENAVDVTNAEADSKNADLFEATTEE
jgi:hypothetical protein